MEKLLFALLISIIICKNPTEPYNVKNKDGNGSCGSGQKPGGVSDCIDQTLWVNGANYGHCCYARYQLAGVMDAECVGLTEEEYLDIVEYIRMEEHKNRQLKIYDINCFSSYLKIFGAYLLLALLF